MHLALFERAKLEAGETLLVTAGASGLGTAGIQLGSRRNKTLYHMAGPGALLRNLSMPLLARSLASRTDSLFAYDAFAAARA